MTGTAPSESSPKPVSRESHQELARERAEHHWQGIRSGFTKVGTGDFSASTLLGEMKGLVDQMPQLSDKHRKEAEQGFKRMRRNPQFKDIIDHELKEAFLAELGDETKNSGESQRKLYEALAKELGYLGNIVGIGVDVEVSKAIGPRLRGRRTAAVGTVAAVATLGAAWVLGDASAASEYATGNESPPPKPASQDIKTRPPLAPTASPTATIPPKPQAPPPSMFSPDTKPAPPSPSPSAGASPSPSPEALSTPIPEPTSIIEPTKENLVEIGEQNLAEFFLGSWVQELKGKGLTLWENDPSYRERVKKEFAESDNITIVYLGTDNERDRDGKAKNDALSDVIMVEVFNPHTFKTVSFSLNRDLLAPEGADFGRDRINSLTTIRGVNPYPLVMRTLETATGLRIDGIIQTNVDLVNGYDEYWSDRLGRPDGRNSIIDKLVPEGIEVNPARVIDDPEYPKGYGVQHVHFEPGPQVLHGQDLVRYARARKGAGNDDYHRSERQREVMFKFGVKVAEKLYEDLKNKNTDTLDRLITELEEQQDAGNLFQYDIDMVGVMAGIRDSLQEIQGMKNGDKILAKLAANSSGNFAGLFGTLVAKITGFGVFESDKFVSYGLSIATQGTKERPMPPLLQTHSGYITRIKGDSENPRRRTKHGNYIAYWEPFRDVVSQLVTP